MAQYKQVPGASLSQGQAAALCSHSARSVEVLTWPGKLRLNVCHVFVIDYNLCTHPPWSSGQLCMWTLLAAELGTRG